MKKQEKEWVVHLSKAVEGFFDEMKGVVPEDTKTHIRASMREMLLAFRTFLDKGIDLVEKKEKKKRQPKKVEVK